LITRRAARWAAIVCGVVLIGGLQVGHRLTGTPLMLLSVVWLLALAEMLWLAFQVLRAVAGTGAAALLVLAGATAPIFLTAIPYPPEWSLRLPCPRNWAWTPTWLLRSSPMASLRFDVGGARVKVCYGSPAARGRRMLGGSPVPFGRIWRTGANEPTTIVTTAPIEVAGVVIPRGRASLYTVPGPETWDIIFNASTAQWGIESEYGEVVRRRELGHAIVRAGSAADYRERLTFTAEPPGAAPADTLVLRWESTRVALPVRSPP
jgi:hypothetical protein